MEVEGAAGSKPHSEHDEDEWQESITDIRAKEVDAETNNQDLSSN